MQVFSGPSFVGFDVETANSARGSICVIGLTVVTAGRITAIHSWLCRPPAGLDRFDPGNIGIHGITPNAVAREPSFMQRLSDMLDVVGDLSLIAHNASFDIGALREAFAADEMTWRPLQYGCTLMWSRHGSDREQRLPPCRWKPSASSDDGTSSRRNSLCPWGSQAHQGECAPVLAWCRIAGPTPPAEGGAMADRCVCPARSTEGFEIINGIGYNTTPDRALRRLSPEDRELWLAMVADRSGKRSYAEQRTSGVWATTSRIVE
ncbi:exonuclease domain-containing protein [Prescottella agglutinans]|jgi:hypothetical protein|nr:exonuclease domain-containing protein [Prescottella agglutinans]